jgi:hypothetical protein
VYKIIQTEKIAVRIINTKDLAKAKLKKVTIPEATYIQLTRKSPEDEQNDSRNM